MLSCLGGPHLTVICVFVTDISLPFGQYEIYIRYLTLFWNVEYLVTCYSKQTKIDSWAYAKVNSATVVLILKKKKKKIFQQRYIQAFVHDIGLIHGEWVHWIIPLWNELTCMPTWPIDNNVWVRSSYYVQCGETPDNPLIIIIPLRRRRNGCHFADDLFKSIFLWKLFYCDLNCSETWSQGSDWQ